MPRSSSQLARAGDLAESFAAPGLSVDVARENEAWICGLQSDAPNHEGSVARLYALLTKMAFTEIRRRTPGSSLAGPEMDDVARQAAADATLTICRKIDTFRGDCRFTTWAYRFVAFEVSSKVNRHHWRRGHLSLDDHDWVHAPDPGENPERLAENADLIAAVRRVVAEDMTTRQQRVFEAIAMQGTPVAQVAADLDSNANAIYKALFDARKKLRAALVASGYLAGDM